jgi:hypothetical protein
MPYDTSSARLRSLIDRACKDPEIQTNLQEVVDLQGTPLNVLTDKVITRFLLKTPEIDIWGPAQEVTPQIQALEAERDAAVKERVEQPELSEPIWLRRLLISPGIMIILVGLVILGASLIDGGSAVLNAVLSFSWFFPLVVGLLALPIFAYIAARNILNRQHSRRLKTYEEISARVDPRISDLERQIDEKINQADNDVLSFVIKPILRELINMERARSYDLTLELLPHDGLVEVRNQKYDISTEAYRQLNHLVKNMRGGSIGLAGPRGSGKTTLMDSISQIPKLDDPRSRIVPVMTSAPVTYETRDFIILIFKMVCKKYLSPDNPYAGETGTFSEMDQEFRASRSDWLAILFELTWLFGRRTLLIISALGLALVMMSFFLAASTAAQSTISAGTATALASPTAPGTSPANETPVAGASPVTAAPAETTAGGSGAILEKVGITPASLFRWGWILVLTAAAIFALRNRLVQKVIEDDSLRGGGLEEAILRSGRKTGIRREDLGRIWERREQVERGDRDYPSGPKVLARKWLRDLRFQQSYSSGWSGSLNLPLGVEAGLQNSMQLAQHQLSLPEIISGFKDFMKLLPSNYTFIIGIDELDKLASAEDAYKFLNGIKSLFGLNNCFYVISVSENAMSSFERRGLPIRDEFDSSFDKIVYVNYLDYWVSQRLLNRRVIGIPVPFIAFCYCLSGGLPRDLIRCCRLMFEILEKDPTANSLDKLSHEMIKFDLSLKLQAVAIEARQSKAFDDANKLLEGLYRLESLLRGSSSLPFNPQNHFQTYVGNGALARKTKKIDEEKRKLAILMTELDTYLYYVATLHTYFTNLDVERFKKDEDFELDSLARARQLFAYSTVEAQRVIKDFRRSHRMDRPATRAPRRRTAQKTAKKAKPATAKKSAG